ncbi:MAG: hypothetical protein IJN83_04395, partial [Clostridia bacterium]|nr:hypothetical protein [Clostridia bacterium]
MKSKALLAIILACLCMSGCVNTASVIDPLATMPPEPTAIPEPTPTPAPTPYAAELDMADLSSAYDEPGVLISTADHFEQYV